MTVGRTGRDGHGSGNHECDRRHHRSRLDRLLGLLLPGLVGTAIAVSPYWLIAVAITGAYFLVSAVVEERTMAQLFPAAYPPYRRVTKMLIPFLL